MLARGAANIYYFFSSVSFLSTTPERWSPWVDAFQRVTRVYLVQLRRQMFVWLYQQILLARSSSRHTYTSDEFATDGLVTTIAIYILILVTVIVGGMNFV